MSLSRLLDISRSSLGVYQKAMDITSNNIANANNPNFSRQRIVLGTERANVGVIGEYGAGVKIEDVQRVKNDLTELQIRNYNQKYGDVNKRSVIMEQIESIFAEPTDLGLSSLLNNFYNAWDELAVTPNSQSLRSNVVQTAQNVSVQIQNIYDGLIQARSDVKSEAESKVDDLNSYLQQVELLNQQIAASNINDTSSNGLLDERDKVLNELSKLANINVSFNENRIATVTVGGVFAADQYNSVTFKTNIVDDKLVITTDSGTSKLSLNSGELFALTDTYSNDIKNYIDKVDAIGHQLVESVNAIHETGYPISSTVARPVKFFTNYMSGVLTINSAILDDSNAIAVSSNGESGNGEIALQLAELAKSKVLDGQSINDFYNSFVSEIGIQKSINDQSAQSNQLVLEQLENQKASYSSVSLDEEMTNVIKYQRSYEASARLIKAADEMLQTILGILG